MIDVHLPSCKFNQGTTPSFSIVVEDARVLMLQFIYAHDNLNI